MPGDLSTRQRQPDRGFVPAAMRWLASAWVALGLVRWVSRLAVALVFVLGMLATASATRAAESESDVAAESGEDSESVEQVNVHASTSRRPSAALGARARAVREPQPPRCLHPRRSAPARRSWLHPRRTVPPDDDDDESLA